MPEPLGTHFSKSAKIRKECFKQIKAMLDAKIIQHSSSDWHSPVIMVRKHDNSYHFAVDYRRFKAVTISIVFLVIRFEHVICYAGRTLHSSEKNWGGGGGTQLECLMVVVGSKTFRV